MNPLALLKVFGFVPGWAWAAFLAAALAHGCVTTSQRDTARSDASAAKTALAQAELAVANNKIRAAHLLAGEIQKNIDLERAMAASLAQQEQDDAKNRRVVADYRAQLRAAAGAFQRLRDPNADQDCGRGGGSDSPATAVAADTAGGPGAGAVPGGLLSGPLTALLQDLTERADRLNVAYASCRGQAYSVRGAAPR